MTLERLEPMEYPTLHALLDDVLVLGTHVQRQSLRWLPGPPANEALELRWLEGYLAELADAASRARVKVEWRRKAAESRAEAARVAEVKEGLDERWEAKA